MASCQKQRKRQFFITFIDKLVVRQPGLFFIIINRNKLSLAFIIILCNINTRKYAVPYISIKVEFYHDREKTFLFSFIICYMIY